MLHKMFCDNETQTRQDKGMVWHGPTYTTMLWKPTELNNIEVARFKILSSPWFVTNVNFYWYFYSLLEICCWHFFHCKQLSYNYSRNKEKYMSFGNNLAFKYQYILAFNICTVKLLYLPWSNFYVKTQMN